MKRLLTLLCGLLALALLLQGQTTMSLKTGDVCDNEINSCPTKSIEELDNSVTLTYQFSNVAVRDDHYVKDSQTWHINGFVQSTEVGKPSVPIHFDSFVLPGNYSADAIIDDENSEYVEFDGILAPARRMQTDDEEVNGNQEIVPITPYDGFYPTDPVKLAKPKIYRGINVQQVEICPVLYDYKNHKIRAYTKLVYKINYIDKKSDDGPSLINPGIIASGDPVIFNKDVYQPKFTLDHFEGKVDNSIYYLIITTPNYLNAAKKLANWKNLLGYNTEIISKSNWTPDLIKTNVKEFYADHPSLYYLLIIGDSEDVPPEHHSYGIYNYATDYYYGCLDGENDDFADLRRGRISVSSAEEANTVINKIINYERNPATNTSMYNNGINCAYFQDKETEKDPNGFEDRRFTLTSEEIRNYLLDKNYNVRRIYCTYRNIIPTNWNNDYYSFGGNIPDELKRPNFAWNGNAKDIVSSINSGAFYVLFRGHGMSYGWDIPYFTSNHVNQLTNNDMLPVFFNITCQNGMFAESSPCIAETILRKSNGGGVAVFAASQTSFSGTNDALICGMFDGIWPTPGLQALMPGLPNLDLITHEPVKDLGSLMEFGFNRINNVYGTDDPDVRYTKQIFHCFGDPGMKIRTKTPTQFSNVKIDRRNGEVAVNLDEKGKITFYDRSTGDVQYRISKSYSIETSNPENISVCVSGDEKIPYIDTEATSNYNLITLCSPNPVQNFLYIYYSVDSNVKSMRFHITDISGNPERTFAGDPSKQYIKYDMSTVRNGVYIVNLIIDGKIQDSKQIIVSH